MVLEFPLEFTFGGASEVGRSVRLGYRLFLGV